MILYNVWIVVIYRLAVVFAYVTMWLFMEYLMEYRLDSYDDLKIRNTGTCHKFANLAETRYGT